MITIEDKCMELVELMYSTKHNTSLYNEVFIPQYKEFKDYCLIFMEEEELFTYHIVNVKHVNLVT